MNSIKNKLQDSESGGLAHNRYFWFIGMAIMILAMNIVYIHDLANAGEYEQGMINNIQSEIQKYKSSNMSVGNRAKFVSEFEIEKSTIIAGYDTQQAISNLESTENYITSLGISPGNERKLLDFVRKAKIVLLRKGVPNSTFPGFNN
ncbi:MAG: hypothetical protein KKF37_00245 [Proteobacteria bacterium]|nr:hypothetical protein [Pseudomonadota bacterium]